MNTLNYGRLVMLRGKEAPGTTAQLPARRLRIIASGGRILSGPISQPELLHQDATGRTMPGPAEHSPIDAAADAAAPTSAAAGAQPRDPASGFRLGAVRGLLLGLALSAILWAGVAALIRLALG